MDVTESAGRFTYEGRRLHYRVYGTGPRVTVLVHGLLLTQRMHVPLARALAARGGRVVTLDLYGHGRSDRPPDMWRYGMGFFARDVVALLACAVAFTPLMVALTVGEPLMRGLSRLARLVPESRAPWAANVLLDTVRQAPAPSAAVLQGIFAGRTAPHRSERRTFTTPALVIGHQRDPVHPFSDAGLLAEELPNARLLEASSIVELRVAPDRLTAEIADFIDECWRPRPAQRARRRSSRR